jgi:hypothetical protein
MTKVTVFVASLILLGGIFTNAKTENKPTEPEVSLFNKKAPWKGGQITKADIQQLKVGDQVLKVVLNGKQCSVQHFMFALGIKGPARSYIESTNTNLLDENELSHLKTMQKGDLLICASIEYKRPDGTVATTKVSPLFYMTE